MKRLNKGIVLIALLAMCAASGFAQGSKKIVIAYVVKTLTNPYYHQVQIGAEDAAKAAGVGLIFQAPARHGDTEAQVRILEDLLAQKPSALCLIPDNYTALIPVLKRYNQAKIPVIIADTRIAEGMVDTVTFVGYEDAAATAEVASYIAKMFSGKGKVAILEGQRGSSTAEARLKGYTQELAKYPNMKIVASLTAGWDREKGLKVTQDILQANPDIVAVLASNDEMALGAVQAVKEAGLMGKVVVTGFDAIDAAVEAVRKGDLLATVDATPSEIGRLAVQSALDFLKTGKKPGKEIVYPLKLLTKESLKK